jgi:hypothetical protein
MTDQSDQAPISLPLVWVGADDLPVNFVNQFLGVVQPNEIFLTVGSMVPPAILGDTLEEREATLRNITYVPVKPVARLGFTPARLRELIKVLQDTLSNYEQLPKQEA